MKADEVEVLLEQLAAAAALEGGAAAAGSGEAWRQTWTSLTGGLMDDGVVADGAYAALPHLVEAVAALPPGQTADFWVDLGCIVTADHLPPVPADLEAGFGAALRLAERAAARSLLAAGVPAQVCARLVLSCAAFAGHHTGEALNRLLDPRESGLLLVCPGCGSDTEIPGFFADPARPPSRAPGLPDPAPVRQTGHPWGEFAAALREDALGEGWEPFLRVARDVAVAGVSPGIPGQAVLCLVAGMVAVRGTPQGAAEEFARQLMALTGHFRCWDCERTWTIADGLAENPHGARPARHRADAWTDSGGPATTTESAAAGRTGEAATRFRQDGNAVLAADGTPWGRISVFSESAPGSSGGVDALAVVSRPGRPTLVAGAGASGVVRLWDAADGRLVHDPLPGHPDRVRSMTSLPLPDGRVLLASGDDAGTIALWDPATGRPLREPAGDRPGGVTGMCTATVPDGRTLLVTATPRGAVRLWDPDTGECVGRLNPYGSPIQSIAAVPIAAGHTLIAASDTAGRVHVWDPAVDDPWERGAAVQLSAPALAGADHRVAAVAAAPAPGRAVLATGDNRGTVILWDLATGAPIGELPYSTGTAGLPVITAGTLHGGRTVLVTGTRHGHRLRRWEPATGAVEHLALDVALTCLATTGPDLIVGHDRGVLALPLTGQ
ncbi:PQQ-binding-like beta-propeller repeat protein [Streptomyces sp.]|uniref:WD40 repeat domain-containing protein n=1 Tax=Streptomyces sp. TaxID=1931 RepID=UPI0025E26D80|nr:PQQ-binding-like beta-propeller repeat protein [Streptomyces sp.]